MNATALYALNHVLPVAAALLPTLMDTPAARAMLVAIALQESGFTYRRQIAGYNKDGAAVYGPARGWWQFEMGGVEGVLEHHASRPHAFGVARVLGYNAEDQRGLHMALEHNDVLAAVFARLYLYTDPRLLPQDAGAVSTGWHIYRSTWRPGAPKPDTWPTYFAAAWTASAERGA